MRKSLAAFGLLALVIGGQAALADEIVTVEGRRGVAQPFLLLDPEDGSTAKDVVILFPADEGEVEFRKAEGGHYEVLNRGGGLTARRPMRETLRRNGFAVAVVAPPSDRSRLDSAFRKSAEHAQDIQQMIAFLRQRYPGKMYLHGHCLGSLSAASVASRLKDAGIAGVVFSSARLSGRDGAVTDFQPGAISAPVLFVQHKDDSCPFSRYDAVREARQFFQASARKVDLVTVTGGASKVTTRERCKNGFHGFRGVERETAQAVTRWLQDKQFPALVSGAPH